MKGIGVPLTFRKWNTDQAVSAAPNAMNGIAVGSLAPSGSNPGRFSALSTVTAKNTKRDVNTPKISNPIGVSNVRVFLVPVAVVCNRVIHC